VLGLAGVLLWQKNNTSQTTKTSGETAGWKTFANYGFTIDYPDNWIVKSSTQGAGVAIQNLPEVNLGTSDLSLKVEGSFFQVEMYKTKSGDKTIRDWINSGDIPQSVKQDRLKQIVNMSIAGENREVFTGSGDWQSGVEFVDSRGFCRLHYMSGSPEQFRVDSATFQKMLNSFKFTK
jgi:hypothetical protein